MGNKFYAAALAACAVGAIFSRASKADTVLYRETFGDVSGQAGNPTDAPESFDWAVHYTAPGNTTTATFYNTYNSTTIANINLTLNPNGTNETKGTTSSYNQQVNAGATLGTFSSPDVGPNAGLPFATAAAGATLFWTPEYATTAGGGSPLDPSANPGLTFSWLEGNASTTANWRLAVQVGGVWYASAQSFVNTAAVSQSGATSFYSGDDAGNNGAAGHGAEKETFLYTTNKSAWDILNFNGTYTLGTGTTSEGTAFDSSVPLALGANPANDLSGTITAFGLFSDQAGTGNRRFDSFTISVPEPATLGMAALVLPALARRRRKI